MVPMTVPMDARERALLSLIRRAPRTLSELLHRGFPAEQTQYALHRLVMRGKVRGLLTREGKRFTAC